MKKLIIAVDFDDTVAYTKFPKILGEVEDAHKYLTKLKEDGHELILWTCRANERLSDTKAWLVMNGFTMFNSINENTETWKERYPEFSEDTPSRKVFADVYIDDKQIGGLPKWADIYDYINKIANHDKIYENFEMFNDESYYNLWCVRNTNDKRFNSEFSFHFVIKEDAECFLKLINKAK
jgi:hypothetical protein